jgi:hypothetical protein
MWRAAMGPFSAMTSVLRSLVLIPPVSVQTSVERATLRAKQDGYIALMPQPLRGPSTAVDGFDCSQLFTLPHRQVRNTLRPRHVPGEDHPVFTGFFCKLTPRIAPVS